MFHNTESGPLGTQISATNAQFCQQMPRFNSRQKGFSHNYTHASLEHTFELHFTLPRELEAVLVIYRQVLNELPNFRGKQGHKPPDYYRQV